jgi:hypothetical protein
MHRKVVEWTKKLSAVEKIRLRTEAEARTSADPESSSESDGDMAESIEADDSDAELRFARARAEAQEARSWFLGSGRRTRRGLLADASKLYNDHKAAVEKEEATRVKRARVVEVNFRDLPQYSPLDDINPDDILYLVKDIPDDFFHYTFPNQ